MMVNKCAEMVDVVALRAAVIQKLATDYGLIDVPPELILHIIETREHNWTASECAFIVANNWQRGLSTL